MLGGVFWTTTQSVSVAELEVPSVATTVTHHDCPFTVAPDGMVVLVPSVYPTPSTLQLYV